MNCVLLMVAAFASGVSVSWFFAAPKLRRATKIVQEAQVVIDANNKALINLLKSQPDMAPEARELLLKLGVQVAR